MRFPQRTQKQISSNIIRPSEVMALKAVRREFPDSSRFFHLWYAVRERNKIALGVTTPEIAAGLFEKTFETNYDRAMYLARELIRHFQKWKRNKTIVLKSARNLEDGKRYYYNMQRVKEYVPVQVADKKIVRGLMVADQRDLEKLKTERRRKRRLEAILLAEEEMTY